MLAPYAPVGPVADGLEELSRALREAGVPVARVRRSWDEALWPLATKGFFPFRQRSPAVLDGEGVRI